jgi:hypothetical protein
MQASDPHVWGCIRPGCVYLTLDLLVRQDERQAALARGALSLMCHLLQWCSCWREQKVLLQIHDSIAISTVRAHACATPSTHSRRRGSDACARMQPGEEPVALDLESSRLWRARPQVARVAPAVLLTDGETPLRLRVCGERLPGACTRGAPHNGKDMSGVHPAQADSLGYMPRLVQDLALAGGASREDATEDSGLPSAADRDAAGAGSRPASPAATASNPQVVVTPELIARCKGDDQLLLHCSRNHGMPADAVDVTIRPPCTRTEGSAVVWLEGWSGTFLSAAVPVFVTTDIDLACAVEKLLERFRTAQAMKQKVR